MGSGETGWMLVDVVPVLLQGVKEYLHSILGREVCATTSDNNHLLDVTTLSKVSGQHGFCQSDSMVDFKADAKQFGVYNIFWTKDATAEHWDPGILRFICPATLQHLVLVFSYRAYGVSVEDGLIGDLEMKRYIHVEENMPIILFDVHTMASLVWLSQAQQLFVHVLWILLLETSDMQASIQAMGSRCVLRYWLQN
jgi:hypothetical protein